MILTNLNILYSPKMVAKIKKYKQMNSIDNTPNTHYVQSQNTTIFAKWIDRIIVITNKFLRSFFKFI